MYIDQDTHQNFLKRSILEDKDILICIAGTLGRCAVITNEELPANTNQAVCFIRLINKNDILINFILNALSSFEIQKSLLSQTKVTAIPNLTLEIISNCLIPLPPINEQNEINNKIKKLLPYIEKYDEKQENLEILNKNYKEELKKSILQYAIQGKLVGQDINDESADILIQDILNEKRKLIKEKQIKKENLSVIYKDDTDNQFYEKFDDGTIINITDEIPFEIPDNWSWTKLKNVCKIITCGYASTPQYVEKGYPFISAKNIKPYRFLPDDHKYISEELYKRLTLNTKPEKNDILLTRVGAGIGEAAIIDKEFDFAIYVSLTLIKLLNYKLISNKYILNYILSPFGIKNSLSNIYGKGASQGNLNVNNVREFLVPIPPLNQQYRINEKIDKLFNTL